MLVVPNGPVAHDSSKQVRTSSLLGTGMSLFIKKRLASAFPLNKLLVLNVSYAASPPFGLTQVG
jgi:hypothetical protein